MPTVLSLAPAARGAAGRATPALSDAHAAALAPQLKALGDPVRLRMVGMIAAADELCVCEITPAFTLASATVSHHLKLLKDAGLIRGERRGTFVHYRIQPAALALLAALQEASGGTGRTPSD